MFKSAARAVRSVRWVKWSVKAVLEAIFSRISGKSTRGSLAATASRKAKSEGGSSGLSSGLRVPGKDKEVLFSFYDFSRATLAASADQQPHRIDLRYRPVANSSDQRLWFTNRLD